MCIKAGVVVLRRVDIAVAQQIQLLFPYSTGGIDWEQDGPGDAATDQADDHGNLEISQQEKGVDGLVVQDVAIRDLEKGANPIEQAAREVW